MSLCSYILISEYSYYCTQVYRRIDHVDNCKGGHHL